MYKDRKAYSDIQRTMGKSMLINLLTRKMQLKSENLPIPATWGKCSSLVSNVGGVNVVEDWNSNELLFVVTLHYQLELVQAPSRGNIVGRDNHDSELRVLYSFLNFVGNGVANLKCFVIFKYFVNSLATELSVQKAGYASADIFSSEAEEDIVLPHDTRQVHRVRCLSVQRKFLSLFLKRELGRWFLNFDIEENYKSTCLITHCHVIHGRETVKAVN